MSDISSTDSNAHVAHSAERKEEAERNQARQEEEIRQEAARKTAEEKRIAAEKQAEEAQAESYSPEDARGSIINETI